VTAYDGEDKQNEKVELKRLTGRRKEAVPSTFLLTPLLRGEDELIVIYSYASLLERKRAREAS
jgi:hypothetical protein